MVLYIDLDRQVFQSSQFVTSRPTNLKLKRGDSGIVRIQFLRNGIEQELSAGAVVQLGIKEIEKYDTDFLALAPNFAEPTAPETFYSAALNLNTASLMSALAVDLDDENDIESIEANLEVTWSEDGGSNWLSSESLVIKIANDVIRGDEGSPLELPGPDDYIAARALMYDREQSLTSSQQLQARQNIDLGTAATANTGTSQGNVPILGTGGLLDPTTIPALKSNNQIVAATDISSLTAAQGDEITLGTTVYTTDGAVWRYKGTGSKNDEANYIFVSDSTPDWNAIENKPDLVTRIDAEVIATDAAATRIPLFLQSDPGLGDSDRFALLKGTSAEAFSWLNFKTHLQTWLNNLATIAGAKVFSGLVKLSNQSLSDNANAVTVKELKLSRSMMNNTYTYPALSVGSSDGGAAGLDSIGKNFPYLLSGTANNGNAFARFAASGSLGFGGIFFQNTFAISGTAYFAGFSGTTPNSVRRLLVGSDAPASQRADIDAFTAQGVGIEVANDPSSLGMRVRLIYHDGTTYKMSAWQIMSGGGNTYLFNLSYAVENVGNGTINLYLESSGSRGGPKSTMSNNPAITVTDGPTGLIPEASSNIDWVSCNASANSLGDQRKCFLWPLKITTAHL